MRYTFLAILALGAALDMAACLSPWSTKAQKPTAGLPAPPLVQPIDPKLNQYIMQHCTVDTSAPIQNARILCQ